MYYPYDITVDMGMLPEIIINVHELTRENHSNNSHHMQSRAVHKITESHDVIRLHWMYYQDDVTVDMAMLWEM